MTETNYPFIQLSPPNTLTSGSHPNLSRSPCPLCSVLPPHPSLSPSPCLLCSVLPPLLCRRSPSRPPPPAAVASMHLPPSSSAESGAPVVGARRGRARGGRRSKPPLPARCNIGHLVLPDSGRGAARWRSEALGEVRCGGGVVAPRQGEAVGRGAR